MSEGEEELDRRLEAVLSRLLETLGEEGTRKALLESQNVLPSEEVEGARAALLRLFTEWDAK